MFVTVLPENETPGVHRLSVVEKKVLVLIVAAITERQGDLFCQGQVVDGEEAPGVGGDRGTGLRG